MNEVFEECDIRRVNRLLDFREICWRSSAGIWVIHNDQIIFANPFLAKLLEYELDALVGKSPTEFVHPDDRHYVQQQMLQDLSGEAEGDSVELRLVRSNGGLVSVEALESRLASESGTVLIGTMIDITARKRIEASMQDRIGFERLLAELSASFVNLPADGIDGQINVSLQCLVEFLGNDRSTLAEFSDDDLHLLVTYSYAVPGCEALQLGMFPTDRLPWFIDQCRCGRTVFVRDASKDLPPQAISELAYCRENGILSNVTVPLMAGGQILGGLTFAFVRQHCQWSTEMIMRLKLIGEVFANALMRKRTEKSLKIALAENKRLRQTLEQENLYFREEEVLRHRHERIVGRSDAMVHVLADAERVAPIDTPVLLLGETGTGKELLAQAIHELSGHRNRRMVIVNCASLPATLIESELFGRAEGAYTGAASAQVGRFELADESTLFLDEIGELPLELQAKLLRVLQDGRFERLGSPNTITVNVRLIAATNRDLELAVREHMFRADLYHRLNVFPIQIPPLRDRSEDVPPLVWKFVESFGNRMGKAIKCIPRKTMQQLQQYPWPGNVRELSNVIERAMILTTDDTLHVELPAIKREAESLSLTLNESQKQEILRVLQHTGWRIRGISGAAEKLGMKPTTLEARMARLGIKRPKSE